MATPEVTVQPPAPADVAQQNVNGTAEAEKEPKKPVEVTEDSPQSGDTPAAKPAEDEKKAEQATSEGQKKVEQAIVEVDKNAKEPTVKNKEAKAVAATDAEANAETAAEAKGKPAQEEAASPPTKEGVTPQEEKTGFLTSLKKGLNIALVPKPSLNNAEDKKEMKKEVKAVQDAPTQPPVVASAESAEGKGAETPEGAQATTASRPTPPTRRSSFAAFKQRVSQKITTPGVSPSGTPTKKGAAVPSAVITTSPPASPRKSTSARVPELADRATSKATEGPVKADEGAAHVDEGGHNKVDQLKEKAEALGRKIEGAFHKKPSVKAPSDTERQAATAPETPSERLADTPPAVQATASPTASPTASAESPANLGPTPTKTEPRFRNLKKRFSSSVYPKTGDKDGYVTPADEGASSQGAKDGESGIAPAGPKDEVTATANEPTVTKTLKEGVKTLPASPSHASTTKATPSFPPSPFTLEKLNRLASKAKEEIKVGRSRMSMDFGRSFKKEKEQENGKKEGEEENKKTNSSPPPALPTVVPTASLADATIASVKETATAVK